MNRPTPPSSSPDESSQVPDPTPPSVELPAVETTQLRRGVTWRLLRQRKAAIGAGIVAFFVVASVFAPLLSPHSPKAQTCASFEPPSGSHWLGCDDGGIDVLSQLLQGGRTSLLVGVAAAMVALLIGGVVGIVSGYFGGWFDSVLMRVTDYLLVIPDFVLLVVVATVWGPSLWHIVLVIGVLLWTSNARLIRAQVISLRSSTYVKRTRSIGASDGRIIWRHILPHVSPILISTTVLTITDAIYMESALAFLGLSDPGATSWGAMLGNAFERTAVSAGAWWAIIPVGLCLAAVVLGCFLFGQAIEDALNPRLKNSHVSVRSWRYRAIAATRGGNR